MCLIWPIRCWSGCLQITAKPADNRRDLPTVWRITTSLEDFQTFLTFRPAYYWASNTSDINALLLTLLLLEALTGICVNLPDHHHILLISPRFDHRGAHLESKNFTKVTLLKLLLFPIWPELLLAKLKAKTC